MGIMSEIEVRARQEVELENYIMHVQIEGRMYDQLVYNHIIPSAVGYQNKLIKNVLGIKEVYGKEHKKLSEGQSAIIKSIAEHLSALKENTDRMINARKKANKLIDTNKKAAVYCNNVKPIFDIIRLHCDKLEQLVDNQVWPLTKYQELLFAN